MLKYQTIFPDTLGLLKDLMKLPFLSDFYLVGGTGLALQIGHRISVDLDLFTNKEFETEEMIRNLENQFPVKVINESKNSINLVINNIEVDIIRHNYPLIDKLLNIDDIRLLSERDIAAMKLSAIARRGSRKDFYDLYFLLQKYSVTELLDFYKLKYSSTEIFHIIKSMVYFDEAELDPQPRLITNISWEKVKKLIMLVALEN